MKRAAQTALISTLISALVLVYGVELYLTFYSDEARRISDWSAKHYDLRTREEVMHDLEGQGQNPTFALVPKYLLDDHISASPFPLGGIANRQTVFCNETGKWAVYDSDEHGFNNPKGFYGPGLDVLLAGESFTQGACVAQEETIAAHLRAQFPRTLSLGMEASGSLITLASLMEYGPELKPKTVVWGYIENSMGRMNAELREPELAKYLKEDGYRQGLLQKQSIIDHFWESYLQKRLAGHAAQRQEPGFHAQNFATLFYVRKYYSVISYLLKQVKDQGDAKSNDTNFKTIIEKARQTTESWGGKFIFVYLATPYTGKKAGASDHEHVVAMVREMGIPIIDSFDEMNAHTPEEINAYSGKGHYNARGYQIFSDFLSKGLQSQH